MELVKFASMTGGKDPAGPPFKIPARDLDRNFAALKPLQTDGNNRQYAIEETPEGWLLRLFPDVPGLQVVEVERCDGKRMKVIGTGWYDA